MQIHRSLSHQMIMMIIAMSLLFIVLIEAAQMKSLRENIQIELSSNNNVEASISTTATACPYKGDYCNTCKKCSVSGDTLSCKCSDGHGYYEPTFLGLSTCSTGYIMNVKATLTCFKYTPTSCQYPGHYCAYGLIASCSESRGWLSCNYYNPEAGRSEITEYYVLDCLDGEIEFNYYDLVCYGDT